jgi:hypothetical protein
MNQFVGTALRVVEKLQIVDKNAMGLIMKFCKMYPPEKIGRIVEKAQTYPWHFDNPKAAFMKAVGEINKLEKEATSETK